MSVETVELTGEGATGLITGPQHFAALQPLPTTVRLGRLVPKSRPRTLSFGSYVDRLSGVPLPAHVDYYTAAAVSTARVYLNDQLGCCVWSGKAHAAGVWSAGDADSGPLVLASDQEIRDQYFGVCGRGDNGCYIPSVLDYGVNPGWLFGGKRYKLKGYASVDWRSKELVQRAIAGFGALAIGFALPSAWPQSKVWDVTNTRIVGGHDVTPCGYGANVLGTNADGVVVQSWGRLYLMTWAAFLSSKYLDECYVMVPEFLWTGIDGRNPLGIDLPGLLSDMAKLDQGTVPPLPDPVVPPPPPGPVPPVVPPTVLTGTGSTQAHTIPAQTVSFGLGRQATIPAYTIPGQSVTVTVPLPTPVVVPPVVPPAPSPDDPIPPFPFRVSEPDIDYVLTRAFNDSELTALRGGPFRPEGLPPGTVLKLLTAVIPVVIAGLAAGKPLQVIVAEVVAAIVKALQS